MASPIKSFLFGGRGTGTPLGDLGLTVLRLVTGLLLALGHGYEKMFCENRIGPTREFVDGVSDMGFPAPTLFAWSAVLAEFLGGLLMAAGLLTRPAALMIAVNMAVAAFVAHGGDPWYGGKPSKEMALLYLAPSILLLLTGAGRVSVDSLIASSKASRGGGESRSKKSD